MACVAALGLAGTPGGVHATPTLSRGELTLNLGYGDCMQRAREAFQSLGWVNIGAGGAFTSGFRGDQGAYITCNEVAPGRVLVNIFVASDSRDANVPGAARVQLQDAMGGAPPPRAAAGGGPTSCGWVDGFDQSVAGDIGRGVTDGAAHRNYVLGNGTGAVPDLIANRLATLQRCLSAQAYASLYADVSVIAAAAGRAGLGWRDGQDGSVAGDSGRGVSNWQTHYDHAASFGGGDAPGLMRSRMIVLDAGLPLDVAAQLYADLSVAIARRALGR